MAQIFPESREPEYDSERRVLAQLRKLDDEWHIFHGIKWQALRRDRQADGETDFALFHPTKGILVIEAKGGEVVIDNGDFVRIHHNGTRTRIDSPFDQAEDCKRQLSDFLALEVAGLGHGPRVGRAVAFPHVRVNGDLGPAGPRSIILDAADLADIQKAVQRLVDHWRPPQALTSAQMARIRQVLLPSVRVKRLLREEIDATGQAIVELTNEQFEILDSIAGNRQALIKGGAGTGKTVLAIERTRRLADLGATVLLLCFNRLLGKALQAEFADSPNVMAGHLHRVVRDVLVKAHHMMPDEPSDEWWNGEALELFPDAAAEIGLEVDAIVIDEAQDFRATWWDPLRLVMRDLSDGWFYVFADEQQALYTDGWQAPFDTQVFTYRLTRNLRNTDPVAAKVSAVFGSPFRPRGLSGPQPKFHVVKPKEDVAQRILERLEKLLGQGVEPAQIQVLATSRSTVDALRGHDVDGIGLVESGQDGIAVETVHSFKGLESPVVLVAIDDVDTPHDRSLVYTGLSRAQSVLEVFGPEKSMRSIDWDAQ